MKSDIKKNDSVVLKGLPVAPFSLFSPPFSLAPIHYGYCQGPDKNHCTSSSYSLEDRRQKEWQTHVNMYRRKTNAPSFSAHPCRESAFWLCHSESCDHSRPLVTEVHFTLQVVWCLSSNSGLKLSWVQVNGKNQHVRVEYTPNATQNGFTWKQSACLCTFTPAHRQRHNWAIHDSSMTNKWGNEVCWIHRKTKTGFQVKSGM